MPLRQVRLTAHPEATHSRECPTRSMRVLHTPTSAHCPPADARRLLNGRLSGAFARARSPGAARAPRCRSPKSVLRHHTRLEGVHNGNAGRRGAGSSRSFRNSSATVRLLGGTTPEAFRV